MNDKREDLRRYPRACAAIYCRPARFRATYRLVVNVGLGGVRIYSDERFKIGRKLELDLRLPDGSPLQCIAEVAWIQALPEGAPAAYDLGLRFLKVPPGGIERIASILEA